MRAGEPEDRVCLFRKRGESSEKNDASERMDCLSFDIRLLNNATQEGKDQRSSMTQMSTVEVKRKLSSV